MSHQHDPDTLETIIQETIRTFSAEQIKSYTGKSVSSLSKAINPNTSHRLHYQTAIDIDKMWMDSHGTTPILYHSTMNLKRDRVALSEEQINRSSLAMSVSHKAGEVCGEMVKSDSDGKLDIDEMNAEISCLLHVRTKTIIAIDYLRNMRDKARENKYKK